MKTISALAVALSVALGSVVAMAPVANAATMMKKPEATACVATKTKPCPVKHAAAKPMHKKHKVVASKKVPATAVKKS